MTRLYALAWYAFLITVPLLIMIIRRMRTRSDYPPGPVALPIIGHLHIFLMKPLLHRTFHQLSTRYGDLMYFRAGHKPMVVVSSPEIAVEMFKNNDLNFASRNYNAATTRLTYGNHSLGFSPYGPYWAFAKKMAISELLGSRMLEQSLPSRTRELHAFIGTCLEKARAGESVNLISELTKMTSNTTSFMLMGVRCAATPAEADEVMTLVRDVTQIAGEFDLSEIFWFDLQGFRNRYEDIFRRLDALLERIISDKRLRREAKKQQGSSVEEKKDFLDKLLDCMEDGDSVIQLNLNHIKALIMDLFFAGIDTTAITMDNVMVELITHPETMVRARKEVDEVIGKCRLVEESDMERLPYIQAVIRETFRLHPPIPMFFRKAINECQINGYTIPANASIFVNVWAIGRDPKIWTDPSKFMPTRFLTENGELGPIDLKGHHYELLPFGTGRRICPAITMTMQDLTTTITAMIQCFHWKVKQERIDMCERPGLVVPRAKPVKFFPTICFTPKIHNVS